MSYFILPFWRRCIAAKKVKSLIIMDNCSLHHHDQCLETLASLRLDYLFLPPETTSILQPIDVGIAKPFKDRIRHKFHDWVVNNFEQIIKPEGQRKKFFKNPSKMIFLEWIIASWSTISEDLVKNGKANIN
jgi:hypothetical protein